MVKKKNNPIHNGPVSITIAPGAMDRNAKGQYEFCDQFCDQMEKMGLSNLLGENGIKELRDYNDEHMKKYDPEYLKKKEADRKTKEPPENPPAGLPPGFDPNDLEI
jgi:hypothetical protein